MQISQRLAETQQLPEFNVLLCPPKKQNTEKKSRILFHIWHALDSHISTFGLQMKSLTCETEQGGTASDP